MLCRHAHIPLLLSLLEALRMPCHLMHRRCETACLCFVVLIGASLAAESQTAILTAVLAPSVEI